MGVYGRITGFSASAGLYFVRMALVNVTPETMSSSGSLKRKRLVLWLTISTSSSLRLTKPWSPPVRAALAAAPVTELAASLTLASALAAAPGLLEKKYQAPAPAATAAEAIRTVLPDPEGLGSVA